ncbi:HIRAN domain-containing protein [Kushneria avicenniae]|uniref:HIRAN domain-containing protein n=1 Tax=Kushneria avicenniae TaxID=402385 RepID=A0A1I1MP85_9GAMM|nr:HIRAN domain-containing protein [Kushneria avicenniae]SFC86662.1 HIRAN domain-containing protein [Kushneria avicenniae]
MNRFIEHLVEPQRLLLCWQARESRNRSRYCVGQLLKSGTETLLKYNLESEEISKAKADGFQGYPAFPLSNAEHHHQVLEAFMRRLPPRNRKDFSRYLELRAIPANAEISNFALLGYSGAKLPNDGFELVHPFDNPPDIFELLLEVAGFRHESEIEAEELQPGDPVVFSPEPENIHDQKAIRLACRTKKIGYVPRGQLENLHRMIVKGASIDGTIFRINGTSDRPLVYVLTRITQSQPFTKGFEHLAEA